jgi:hypothetical protein
MDDERISRREVLRTVGLTGAAAWAAPVLTSRRASASVDRCAKTKARKLCKRTACADCGSELQCGTCSSDVGDGELGGTAKARPGAHDVRQLRRRGASGRA